MTSKSTVDAFVSEKRLAVVGLSRDGKKFGNVIYKELKSKGYQLVPVHPSADSIQGDRCFENLGAIEEPVGGVVIVVQPEQTEQVVKDAAEAGIKKVWMQQGAESKNAIQFCKDNGIAEVHGECIIMFSNPVKFPHSIHKWLWGVLNKLPS